MQSDGEVERFRWKYHGRAGVLVFVFLAICATADGLASHVPGSSGYAQYIGYTCYPLSQCLQEPFVIRLCVVAQCKLMVLMLRLADRPKRMLPSVHDAGGT
jgi:hypothetical protein